jgi:uncharacterized membrane protein
VAALVTAGCNASVQGAIAPNPQPPAASAPAATSTGGGGGGDVQVSFKSQVVPILQAHCAKCHVQGNPNVPFAMFNQDGTADHDSVAYRIDQMTAAIRAGRMPKDKPGSVSDAEISTLEAWSQQGGQDN